MNPPYKYDGWGNLQKWEGGNCNFYVRVFSIFNEHQRNPELIDFLCKEDKEELQNKIKANSDLN